MVTFSRKSNDRAVSTDLLPLVENTAQVLRLCLPKSILIETDLQRGPPALCIPDELSHAILQLGINAGQALEDRQGSIRLVLRHGPPDERLRLQNPAIQDHHVLHVAVADTGIGMDRSTLERTCDPFFTTREPGQGAGLGLAEVYGVMKRLHGAVMIESEPGSGTTVHLFLPADTTGKQASTAGAFAS
jgi:signal transduction histidine kinase